MDRRGTFDVNVFLFHKSVCINTKLKYTGIALRNLLLDGVKVYPIFFTMCNGFKQGRILSLHLVFMCTWMT